LFSPPLYAVARPWSREQHPSYKSLEAKGYNLGRSDGIADDNTRHAIRDFQKDRELPMTGVVDERTAENLGLAWQSEFDKRGADSVSATHSPFS